MTDSIDVRNISERMYEAAFLPELWVPLLDELAIKTGSSAGGIGVYWPKPRGIKTSFELSPYEVEWDRSQEDMEAFNRYLHEKKLLNIGFTEEDWSRGDASDVPYVRNIEKRYLEGEYGSQAVAPIELFNGEKVTLEFARRRNEPRYDATVLFQLNQIYPAFRQSAFFASRLQFERARSNLETLNELGLPAALLSNAGQLLHGNNLFEGIEALVSKTSSGQVTLRGNDTLCRNFARALEQSVTKSVSLPAPADDNRNGAVIHFMPMCRSAQDIFSMSCIVMIVAPVATSTGIPSPDLVTQLFGLTQAETQLATTLASGLSLRDCAAKQGITVGTARHYLNRIFYKTRTGQQSELVSLLKSIPTKSTQG